MPRRRRHRLDAATRADLRARAARSEVLHRYARLSADGTAPVFCTPSRAELDGRKPRKASEVTDFRPIFDGRENAEAAARELEALGARPLRPFTCPRSPNRHHLHLTTDRSPATQRRRRDAAAGQVIGA